MVQVTLTSDNKKKANGKVHHAAVVEAPVQTLRPDKALVGICTINLKGTVYIRLTLRQHHLKSIGNPERLDVRGSCRDGLLIAPGKMVRPYKCGADLFYANIVLQQFESRLLAEPRAQIWMRPEVKNGHLQLPGCPEAWVAVEGEFKREVYHAAPRSFEAGHTSAKLAPYPGDPADTLRADAKEIKPAGSNVVAVDVVAAAPAPQPASTQGVTAPLPRAPAPVYQVPSNLRDMEHVLAGKIGEVRAILKAMEEKTGLLFTLDRNLQVTVKLREKS